jgi:hypothetical protein
MGFSAPPPDLSIEILQCFFAYSSTWRSITLYVVPSFLEAISKMTDLCEPCANLEFAGVISTEESPFLDKTRNFLGISSTLRQLCERLCSPSGLVCPHTTIRLTSIILRSHASLVDLLFVISQCPLLEEAKTKRLTRSKPFAQTETIIHRNLRILTITGISRIDADKVVFWNRIPFFESTQFDVRDTAVYDIPRLSGPVKLSITRIHFRLARRFGTVYPIRGIAVASFF